MFSGPQFLASEIIEKNKVFFKLKNTFKRADSKTIFSASCTEKSTNFNYDFFFQAEIMSLK